MNNNKIENSIDKDYSIFEFIPLEDIDLGKYRNYSIIIDKSIEARYFIIHEIGLIVINRKLDINEKYKRPQVEDMILSK